MTFLAILVGNKGQLITPAFPWRPGNFHIKKCHSWLSLAILSNTRVMLIQPFHESQVILICGKVTPGFLGSSWQNCSLRLQPFQESQVISVSVNVIPGFLGYSWQCSSQLLQPLCESQDIFGNSWLSWLFLLFLLWSNSRLSLKAKSYFLALQAFDR